MRQYIAVDVIVAAVAGVGGGGEIYSADSCVSFDLSFLGGAIQAEQTDDIVCSLVHSNGSKCCSAGSYDPIPSRWEYVFVVRFVVEIS